MRIYFFIFLITGFIGCSKNSNHLNDDNGSQTNLNDWQGDAKSIKILSTMFDQLGGRAKWANVQSLYVLYQQEDKHINHGNISHLSK